MPPAPVLSADVSLGGESIGQTILAGEARARTTVGERRDIEAESDGCKRRSPANSTNIYKQHLALRESGGA